MHFNTISPSRRPASSRSSHPHTRRARDASERRPVQASDAETGAEEGAGQEDRRQEDRRETETGGETGGQGEESRRALAPESSREPVRRRRQGEDKAGGEEAGGEEEAGEEGEEADAGEEGGAQGDQVQGFPGRGARQVVRCVCIHSRDAIESRIERVSRDKEGE